MGWRRPLLAVCCALVLFSLPLSAQNFPRSEQYLGYAVARADLGINSHIDASRGISYGATKNFSPNFGFATLSTMRYDFGDRRFGLFPGWRGGEIMMGPQVNLRPGKWNLFARYLGGLSHQRMNAFSLTPAECTQQNLNCPAIGGLLQGDGSFLFNGNSAIKYGTATGFGVDYKVSPTGALRLFQADYLQLRSIDPTERWQKFWRIEIGVVAWF